jgi:hypothetical protein
LSAWKATDGTLAWLAARNRCAKARDPELMLAVRLWGVLWGTLRNKPYQSIWGRALLRSVESPSPTGFLVRIECHGAIPTKLALERLVAGSNPATPTNKIQYFQALSVHLVRHASPIEAIFLPSDFDRQKVGLFRLICSKVAIASRRAWTRICAHRASMRLLARPASCRWFRRIRLDSLKPGRVRFLPWSELRRWRVTAEPSAANARYGADGPRSVTHCR